MTEQEDSTKRTKATRIDDSSFAFNRIVPAALITLAVITVLMVIASILVLAGIF